MTVPVAAGEALPVNRQYVLQAFVRLFEHEGMLLKYVMPPPDLHQLPP